MSEVPKHNPPIEQEQSSSFAVQAAKILVWGLTATRLAATKPSYDYIAKTDPQDRDWPTAAKTAVVASTDFADGKLARATNTQGNWGSWFDSTVDKLFSTAPMLALNKTDELSPVHTRIKVVRDLGITAVRSYMARKHPEVNVSAQSPGKWKAASEMMLQTAASSPLSQNNDFIRQLASIVSAQQITTGAHYIDHYVKAIKETTLGEESQNNVTTTRNSEARELSAGRIDQIVNYIREKFPHIKADHLTDSGALMVLAAGALMLKYPDRSAIPTALYTTGSLIDAVDGAFARKEHTDNDTELSHDGMLKDVTADKIQEIFTSSMLSITARRRGNNVAANNYALAAMTAALPALLRASGESRGHIVGEAGFGTRATRALLGGIGEAFNKNQDTEDIISGLLLVGSITTALNRRDVVKNGKISEHCVGTNENPEFITAAKVRQKRLKKIATVGALSGAAALAYRPKQRNPKLY